MRTFENTFSTVQYTLVVSYNSENAYLIFRDGEETIKISETKKFNEINGNFRTTKEPFYLKKMFLKF